MRKAKNTNRESWDEMDYMLLVREVSPKLFRQVYFICKYKEVKADKYFLFILFFIILICAYNVWVISPPLLPLPPLPLKPPPLPPNPWLPGRNYFALISSFVEERV
jgi:hypothetical protein